MRKLFFRKKPKEKYLQMGRWFNEMDVRSTNFEYLQNNYGVDFKFDRKIGSWYHNKENGIITFYDFHTSITKTYKLEELKEKAREIAIEKGIIKNTKAPEDYISDRVAGGIDNTMTKQLSKENTMLFLGFANSSDLTKDMNKEEKEIFDAIPFYEMGDVLLSEDSEEDKFNIFMAGFKEMMKPLKIEKK